MKISVIICAAGDGNRLNSASTTPKQYLVVNGKTIIEYSIDKFLELDIIELSLISYYPYILQYYWQCTIQKQSIHLLMKIQLKDSS